MTAAIHVERLHKLYARNARKRHFSTLKSALVGGAKRALTTSQAFTALADISFAVRKGTTVAVIGANGSGKSTLLKVLAGILKPTSGRVEVDGRVAALLELGAGFHPEISGRENIVINGIMLGLGRREIERRIPEIIRFAELEDFIDAPVKTYSSGMYVRLGFSVAVAVEPDVLLVDEVLAVGDEAFSHRCIDRFHDLKRRGRTVLVVTHALELAETLADEILFLEDGRLVTQGPPRETIDGYRARVAGDAEAPAVSAVEPSAVETSASGALDPVPGPEPDTWRPRRWGNRRVEIESVTLTAATGENALLWTGEPLVITVELHAHEPQVDFVIGIALHARDGRLAYGTNTDIERFRPERLEGRSRVRVIFPTLLLLEGSYALDVAVHTRDGNAFDYHRACRVLTVRSRVRDHGVARLEHRWELTGGIALSSDPETRG